MVTTEAIMLVQWTTFSSVVWIKSEPIRGTLLPPSDAYVRSFLYLLYTLIKLYYTKALSDPASSLVLD